MCAKSYDLHCRLQLLSISLHEKPFTSQSVFEFLQSMLNGFLAGVIVMCFSTDSAL